MKLRKEINYYNILGLHPNIDRTYENYEVCRIEYIKNITDKDIKIAYKNLSKIYHPDINNGDDTKFKDIVEAYKVLSNNESREKYDNISKHGLYYDITTELYDFEFSNTSVSNDIYNNNSENFRKKELINILLDISEFQKEIEYDRYVSCKHCDGSGLNPDLVDMFDCDVCDGEGIDRFGNKCVFCNGKGKAPLGFHKCPKCNGDKVVYVKEKILLKKEDFKDNKLVIKFKGNSSKIDQGKIGNLYIEINKNN